MAGAASLAEERFMRKLTPIADQVAADLFAREPDPNHVRFAVLRDACDIATGGDLPTNTLDRLTDMVEARLTSERFSRWRRDLPPRNEE